jgi:hypothetical protein
MNTWIKINCQDDLPKKSGFFEVCILNIPQKTKRFFDAREGFGFKVSRTTKRITHWK